jgi:hypothetical protein
MPIFTYMGSSDFQRDDIHSFAVVEKVCEEIRCCNVAHGSLLQTIESTIPVIVRSMKAKTGSDAELAIGKYDSPLVEYMSDGSACPHLQRPALFYKSLPIWPRDCQNTVPYRE